MTEQELSGYIYIKADIAKTEERLADLKREIADTIGLGSVNMDGMPRGSTPGDPTASKAIALKALHEEEGKLEAELQEYCAKLKEKEREIREFINGIEDKKIKLIIEWRFIDLLDWIEIAGRLEEMTGKNVDRSTPGKKMRSFLKKH